MMTMLVLDSATAAAVAGEDTAGHALRPRPLADGTFALPARVLADPAHARHHATLRKLPRREAVECDWDEADD
jgi:hypothetical protein